MCFRVLGFRALGFRVKGPQTLTAIPVTHGLRVVAAYLIGLSHKLYAKASRR